MVRSAGRAGPVGGRARSASALIGRPIRFGDRGADGTIEWTSNLISSHFYHVLQNQVACNCFLALLGLILIVS